MIEDKDYQKWHKDCLKRIEKDIREYRRKFSTPQEILKRAEFYTGDKYSKGA